MSKRGLLAVPREHVEAALGDARTIWVSDAIATADESLFVALLPSGADWVVIRLGTYCVAFVTARPPAGYSGRRLEPEQAGRALTTLLQGRDPAAVRCSPGWALLKRPPALATEWRAGLVT